MLRSSDGLKFVATIYPFPGLKSVATICSVPTELFRIPWQRTAVQSKRAEPLGPVDVVAPDFNWVNYLFYRYLHLIHFYNITAFYFFHVKGIQDPAGGKMDIGGKSILN